MIAHDKTWGPSYDFLFLLYSNQKKTAEAEEVLKLRLQNDPTSPLAVKNLASYYLATNREAQGEAVIKTVLNDPKSFPNGREMIGDFYAQPQEEIRSGAGAVPGRRKGTPRQRTALSKEGCLRVDHAEAHRLRHCSWPRPLPQSIRRIWPPTSFMRGLCSIRG